MESNKPLPVHGYTPQSNNNVSLVNRNKEIEERILRIIDELRNNPFYDVDLVWLERGREQIEFGFMALNRSIFKPKRFDLPVEDSDNGQKDKS